MYLIKADEQKNLLVIQLEGFLTNKELTEAAQKAKSEMAKLTQGFTVINDISKMKPASPEGAEEIKAAQAEAFKIGVGKIVRVVENPISKMQFNRLTNSAGYTAVEVKSIQEAYEIVESIEI
ncbi:hypothetical protein [Reichenbachiella versicolor]|uniref:hypothetical protein n=1 Tax=Reichenbachiella versicolor TaxID=1821036 RepID=UPI000D6E4777|nr:hypothetical protein [Reichenbachiella versicolor]